MHTVSFDIGSANVSLESGRIARQASGSVVVRHGQSFVLGTAVCDFSQTDADFLPLTVDYREKMAAAAKIPGNFFRREARPSEFETLTSRLIDRSLRPLFPKGFNRPTIVTVTVYSADQTSDLNALAIIAASAALHISDVPFAGPIAGARIIRTDGNFVPAPGVKLIDAADLDLIVSASNDGLVMLEGGAKIVSESTIIDALEAATSALGPALEAIESLRAKCGREKEPYAPPVVPSALTDEVAALSLEKIRAANDSPDKGTRKKRLEQAKREVRDSAAEPGAALSEFQRLHKTETRKRILAGQRVDGRDLTTVRPIDSEVHLLGASHGSSLFTRGDTQALVTTTLGGARDAQDIETLDGGYKNRFILHYNFPGYAVGEARRPGGGAGRREIGHGHLARRALMAVLPEEKRWPYTTRVVSDITESDGSSSMATVCGGTLALLSAGVPLLAPVAGIAMGLVSDGAETAILTDILGEEDHLGDMDFKVAGTHAGVTAVQLDNKLGSLPRELLEKALKQARDARLHILECMEPAIKAAHEGSAENGPRHLSFNVPSSRIGAIVGTGGKTLQGIQSRTNTRIEVSRDGIVLVMGSDSSEVRAARKEIEQIALELRRDGLYKGEVTQTKEFGVFVKIANHEGLVHVSELSGKDALQRYRSGSPILVRVLGADTRGRLKLSQRAAEGCSESEALNA